MRLGLALVIAFVCAMMNTAQSSPAVADRTLIGTWLPQAVLFTAFEKHWSSLTLRPDAFICGKTPVSGCSALRNGTQFKDGRTGTIDEVVYDPRHHPAFYRERCCAMDAAILIAGIQPPPVVTRAADLQGVRTMRGIRLGMSQVQVTRRYGRTSVHSLRGVRAGELLAYATETPASSYAAVSGSESRYGMRNE